MVCHNCVNIALKTYKYRSTALAIDKALQALVGQPHIQPTFNKENILELQKSIIECISMANINYFTENKVCDASETNADKRSDEGLSTCTANTVSSIDIDTTANSVSGKTHVNNLKKACAKSKQIHLDRTEPILPTTLIELNSRAYGNKSHFLKSVGRNNYCHSEIIEISTSVENRKFSCELCKFIGNTRGALRKHKRKHFVLYKHFKCIVCHKMLISRNALMRHLKNVCYKRVVAKQPILELKRVDENAAIMKKYPNAFDSKSNKVNGNYGGNGIPLSVSAIDEDNLSPQAFDNNLSNNKSNLLTVAHEEIINYATFNWHLSRSDINTNGGHILIANGLLQQNLPKSVEKENSYSPHRYSGHIKTNTSNQAENRSKVSNELMSLCTQNYIPNTYNEIYSNTNFRHPIYAKTANPSGYQSACQPVPNYMTNLPQTVVPSLPSSVTSNTIRAPLYNILPSSVKSNTIRAPLYNIYPTLRVKEPWELNNMHIQRRNEEQM